MRPGVLRESLRKRITEILTLWRPHLPEEQAEIMSVVLFQAMKSLVQLHEEKRYPGKPESDRPLARLGATLSRGRLTAREIPRA